jgi:hypothetical protein
MGVYGIMEHANLLIVQVYHFKNVVEHLTVSIIQQNVWILRLVQKYHLIQKNNVGMLKKDVIIILAIHVLSSLVQSIQQLTVQQQNVLYLEINVQNTHHVHNFKRKTVHKDLNVWLIVKQTVADKSNVPIFRHLNAYMFICQHMTQFNHVLGKEIFA